MSASFQDRVCQWGRVCFGWASVPRYDPQRVHRFMEEALELVQACEIPREHVLALVDYVYGRPTGEVQQEVGGVLVTLAILCESMNLDMVERGELELERCWRNVEKIRAKQAAKKDYHSPLPGRTEHDTDTAIGDAEA